VGDEVKEAATGVEAAEEAYRNQQRKPGRPLHRTRGRDEAAAQGLRQAGSQDGGYSQLSPIRV